MYTEIILSIFITTLICFIIWLIYELNKVNNIRDFFKSFDRYIISGNKLPVRYLFNMLTIYEFRQIRKILEEERGFKVHCEQRCFIIS